jgi:beta-glucanase (GH16 family)
MTRGKDTLRVAARHLPGFVGILGLLAVASVTVAPWSNAAPTAGPSTPPSCGGITLYKSPGVPWTCTFDDEFNGTSLNTNNWTVQQTSNSSYHSGQECFVNSPNNVSVSGGTLNLTVRKEAAPFVCVSPSGNYVTQYTSGMVTSYTHFSQTYGAFAVRAKIPAQTAQGLQEAFWLWPDSQEGPKNIIPGGSELDIAEFYSEYPNMVAPTVHFGMMTFRPPVTKDTCLLSDASTQFNNYVIIWTPSQLTFDYDGQTCLTVDRSAGSLLGGSAWFTTPYFINLTQALGIGGNAPDTNALQSATTRIDWVRVWS